MFIKKICIMLLISILLISTVSCTSDNNDSKDKNDIVATVNGINIEREAFDSVVSQITVEYHQMGASLDGENGEEILKQIEQQAIDSLIHEEVLKQESMKKEEELDIPDDEINEELQNIKNQYPSEEEFQTALQENSLTENELQNMIRDQYIIYSFIESEIKEVTVSEEEMKEMYEQYKLQMELQAETAGNEEAEDSNLQVPLYEEMKSSLEAEIKYMKEQQQIGELVEKLVEESEIEIYL